MNNNDPSFWPSGKIGVWLVRCISLMSNVKASYDDIFAYWCTVITLTSNLELNLRLITAAVDWHINFLKWFGDLFDVHIWPICSCDSRGWNPPTMVQPFVKCPRCGKSWFIPLELFIMSWRESTSPRANFSF